MLLLLALLSLFFASADLPFYRKDDIKGKKRYFMDMIFTGRRFPFEVFAEKKRRRGTNHDSWQTMDNIPYPVLPFSTSPFLVYLRCLLHMGKVMEEMHR